MKQKINSLNDTIVNLEYQIDNPNDRNYTSTNLGTWSSVSDVDTFFSRFNRSNNYKDGIELRVGNYVTIQDGTYNAIWEIAGFDMENNQLAADGTVYDNGYGICMIPQTKVTSGKWNTSNTTTGGYKSSYMHTTVLPGIVTKLKTILGSHIVNRNVLLSSSIGGISESSANAYTWTTAYATLMSIGQMNGTFAARNTKYDDGEANYKLPIFNSKDFKTGSHFWSRGVEGSGIAWYVSNSGSLSGGNTSNAIGVRPLIYLR